MRRPRRLAVQRLAAVGAVALFALAAAAPSVAPAWRVTASYPLAAGQLDAVACPTSTICEAVGLNTASTGAVAVRTTNGGTSWSAGTLPAGAASLGGLSCRSASFCVATGEGSVGGLVLVTDNGGASWKAPVLPNGVGDIQAVACPTSSVCEIVGANTSLSAGLTLRTIDGGTVWA
jgi:hypothetical protein